MKKNRIVAYVAGKSGGHIMPCLTLAHEEQEKNEQVQILFFSTEEPLDLEIVSGSKSITWHVTLPLTNISLKKWFNIPMLVYKLIITCIKTMIALIKHRPTKLICTGGFLAIPVAICARILAIPIDMYELNVQPGRATRFLASWSKDLFTCFTETQQHLPKNKCHKVAYPIRFFDNTRQISQREALRELSFDKHRKTVCILGGSQGSLELNRLIQNWLTHNEYLYNDIQIIHQTGRKDPFNWQLFYDKHMMPAHVFSFHQDPSLYYAAADLIICRSGAGTLFEVLFFGKPCITIPLEIAGNAHQVANALALHKEYDDIFTVIRQKQILHNKEIFYQKAAELLGIHHKKYHPLAQQPNV